MQDFTLNIYSESQGKMVKVESRNRTEDSFDLYIDDSYYGTWKYGDLSIELVVWYVS